MVRISARFLDKATGGLPAIWAERALAPIDDGTLRCYRRAVIMPNLHPPITTVASAVAYRLRVMQVVPAGSDFEPLMTLYLSDGFDASEIRKAKDSGFVHAVKL